MAQRYSDCAVDLSSPIGHRIYIRDHPPTLEVLTVHTVENWEVGWAAPHHIRAVAEALGRKPAASCYSPDISRHAFFGSAEVMPESYKQRRVGI